MFQSAARWLAMLGLSAGLAIWLATSLACAFSQENLRGGGANSAFTDPDNQVKNFGNGAHPFGPNGPVLQFGALRSGVSRATTIITPHQSLTLDLWATATDSYRAIFLVRIAGWATKRRLPRDALPRRVGSSPCVTCATSRLSILTLRVPASGGHQDDGRGVLLGPMATSWRAP
jgi:hypothetical protein